MLSDLIPLFKLIQGLSIVLLVIGIVRFLARDRLVNSVLNSSDEKKSRFIHSISRAISLQKIILWMSPIYLLLLPLIAYFYFPDLFYYFLISMLLVYAVMLQEYFYSKSIMLLIEKRK